MYLLGATFSQWKLGVQCAVGCWVSLPWSTCLTVTLENPNLTIMAATATVDNLGHKDIRKNDERNWCREVPFLQNAFRRRFAGHPRDSPKVPLREMRRGQTEQEESERVVCMRQTGALMESLEANTDNFALAGWRMARSMMPRRAMRSIAREKTIGLSRFLPFLGPGCWMESVLWETHLLRNCFLTVSEGPRMGNKSLLFVD